MATNPYFRVLALTATPGNKFESVQTLIDGLHISHIELRDDQSLDLQPYVHQKVSFSHQSATFYSVDDFLGYKNTHH
jgi:ATP-dependent DNA helicase MPH1